MKIIKHWIFQRLTLNRIYILIFACLFFIEVCIATFVTDSFIRPFLWDLLVVVLMYSFLRIFLRYNYTIVALSCLFFAYFIEAMQYFELGKHLGLTGVGKIILGSTFDPIDLIAYSIWFIICIIIEPNKKSK